MNDTRNTSRFKKWDIVVCIPGFQWFRYWATQRYWWAGYTLWKVFEVWRVDYQWSQNECVFPKDLSNWIYSFALDFKNKENIYLRQLYNNIWQISIKT